MSGQTLAEKILSSKSSRKLYAGDLAVVEVDNVLAHDTTCAWAIDPFYEIGKKVFNPDKIHIFFDHAYPAPSVAAAQLHTKIRKFATEQGIKIYTDGVCHQIMAERFLKPNTFLLGADSHTPTGGGLGAFCAGFGSTDAAVAMATGKAWIKVPETIKINLEGNLDFGVYTKDVILSIAKDLSAEGANYKVIEFGGEALARMNVPARLTLCNMCAEMGSKTGIVPADEQTARYLKAQGREEPFEFLRSDSDAQFSEVRTYDISKIEPTVAKPPDIDKDVPVTEVEGTEITQVFLGSCTNCRIEDLEVAYKIIKGRKIADGIKMFVTPASKQVYEQALKAGYIEEFMRAGAIVTSPGCGACLGRHMGVLDDNDVCVSTSNRNFTGRMGSPKAQIYLASPATAVASAIAGKLADPRKYQRRD